MKCGGKASSGEQELYLLRAHLESSIKFCVNVSKMNEGMEIVALRGRAQWHERHVGMTGIGALNSMARYAMHVS